MLPKDCVTLCTMHSIKAGCRAAATIAKTTEVKSQRSKIVYNAQYQSRLPRSRNDSKDDRGESHKEAKLCTMHSIKAGCRAAATIAKTTEVKVTKKQNCAQCTVSKKAAAQPQR
jgi:hypothetical protein